MSIVLVSLVTSGISGISGINFMKLFVRRVARYVRHPRHARAHRDAAGERSHLVGAALAAPPPAPGDRYKIDPLYVLRLLETML